MNKTILAGAISLGLAASAQAAVTSVNVTSMTLVLDYAATGTLFNDGTGTMGSVDPFLFIPWTASAAGFYGDTGVPQTFAGTSPQGAYNYQFTLGAGQIAWGVSFNWNANNGIPILAIMDCGVNPLVGDTCAGIGMPMQTKPFTGTSFAFNGSVASVSAVPTPAAGWLLAAGLSGLIGLSRQHKRTAV